MEKKNSNSIFETKLNLKYIEFKGFKKGNSEEFKNNFPHKSDIRVINQNKDQLILASENQPTIEGNQSVKNNKLYLKNCEEELQKSQSFSSQLHSSNDLLKLNKPKNINNDNSHNSKLELDTEIKRMVIIKEKEEIFNISNNSLKKNCCRICYDSETNGILLNPCLCQGSMKYIHETCMKKWIESKKTFDLNNPLCEVCNAKLKIKFEYKFIYSSIKMWRTIKNLSAFMLIVLIIMILLYIIADLVIANIFKMTDESKNTMTQIFFSVIGGIEFMIIGYFAKDYKKSLYDRIVINWTVVNYDQDLSVSSFISKKSLNSDF